MNGNILRKSLESLSVILNDGDRKMTSLTGLDVSYGAGLARIT
jgi:hypothetical protein